VLPDHFPHLQLELAGEFLRAGHAILKSPGIFSGASIGHVLPNQQSQFVAPVEPASRFDFYMLAGGVEPELLGHLEVELQRFIGGRGVDPIRPVALVERAGHEDGLVVE